MTGNTTPRISVVLPVHNGELYISEAVSSISAQTFADLELIVVDDGSTDRSVERAVSAGDSRLRVIRLPARGGIAAALNAGIRSSTAEFIARMDADDVSLPRRFEEQVAFLDANRHVGICGTWIREFGTGHQVHRLPAGPEHVAMRLVFGWAMAHPSLMFRRSIFSSHLLKYREDCSHAEDLDLLLRATRVTALANLPKVLLNYRRHPGQATAIGKQSFVDAERELRVAYLRELLPGVSEIHARLHGALTSDSIPVSMLPEAEPWLATLREANRSLWKYDPHAFETELRRQWFLVHARARPAGLTVLRSFWRSRLALSWDTNVREHVALAINSLAGRAKRTAMTPSSHGR